MEASPTPSESSEAALKENKLLLKEAGTEMLGEPDKLLLGFIIAREVIIDSMREAGVRPPVKSDADETAKLIYQAYQSMCSKIDERKAELGLLPPPSQE